MVATLLVVRMPVFLVPTIAAVISISAFIPLATPTAIVTMAIPRRIAVFIPVRMVRTIASVPAFIPLATPPTIITVARGTLIALATAGFIGVLTTTSVAAVLPARVPHAVPAPAAIPRPLAASVAITAARPPPVLAALRMVSAVAWGLTVTMTAVTAIAAMPLLPIRLVATVSVLGELFLALSTGGS